ncbi:MAG: helix-turn-helix transcriptional regulator [Vibrio sp.]
MYPLARQALEHLDENTLIIVPPTQVFARQSSDFHSLTDSYVIQAMHFIRHHACQGIKVEQVLDYVKISRSNLENRFKESLGHSIHHEIHFAKLKQACHLLKSTQLSINEIASACGYPSTQYMYSVFKKELQMTPKVYREE